MALETNDQGEYVGTVQRGGVELAQIRVVIDHDHDPGSDTGPDDVAPFTWIPDCSL